MKNLILGLLLSISISNVFGQWSGKSDFDASNWKQFKNGKLYVVFQENGESVYDKALKNVFNQNWAFNDVEFINTNRYEELNTDPSNFFFLTINLHRTKSKSGIEYLNQDFIYFFMSQGHKKGKIQYLPPLADIQAEATGDNLMTFMPVYIRYLQWYSNMITQGKITKATDFKKILKENRSKITNKPLYVLESDLNEKITSVEDIKQDYTGEVYVISKSEMNELIKAKKDVHIFICIKTAGKAWDYIYNIKCSFQYFFF